MLSLIGNTPLIKLNGGIDYFAKIEGANPFGSMKDRAAAYVIKKLLEQNVINGGTEIIESSSGNFGIALAAVCKAYGLKFTCVTDPMISPANKKLLEIYDANIILANRVDANGSYLENRLNIIKAMINEQNNRYWINQYNNPLMIRAYEETLAEELKLSMPNIECVFVPVSTCGCVAGISRRIKLYNQDTKIVAVDIEGSCIFRPSTQIRHIPGMGSPITPENLRVAMIDEIITVSELDCITECRRLLQTGVLVGASSGGAVAAIKKHYYQKKPCGAVVAIFPDRGERYAETIYDDSWCTAHIQGFRCKTTDNMTLSFFYYSPFFDLFQDNFPIN